MDNWSPNPPWKWPEDQVYLFDVAKDCPRCGIEIPPKHRHFWRPCLMCSIRSIAGQALMAAFGLDGHPWLYWGSYPACEMCNGEGYLPCQLQDLSVMRMWGVCETCGVTSTVLIGEEGIRPETAQHADDQANHSVVVIARPLVDSLTDTLDRTPKPTLEDYCDFS